MLVQLGARDGAPRSAWERAPGFIAIARVGRAPPRRDAAAAARRRARGGRARRRRENERCQTRWLAVSATTRRDAEPQREVHLDEGPLPPSNRPGATQGHVGAQRVVGQRPRAHLPRSWEPACPPGTCVSRVGQLALRCRIFTWTIGSPRTGRGRDQCCERWGVAAQQGEPRGRRMLLKGGRAHVALAEALVRGEGAYVCAATRTSKRKRLGGIVKLSQRNSGGTGAVSSVTRRGAARACALLDTLLEPESCYSVLRGARYCVVGGHSSAAAQVRCSLNAAAAGPGSAMRT